MGIRIGTNVASIAAQRHLARNEANVSRASRALSSGSRLVSPGDDAAAFAIAENLRGQAASLAQAKDNADAARGLIQVAEGGLNEQNNILIRLRELAVQAASDTLSDTEREFLDIEFQNLTAEFERIAQTTRYGSQKLLVGANREYEFHLGPSNSKDDIVRYTLDADTRASTLNIDDLSVSDKDDARDALDDIDEALTKIAHARASFGALQSRLEIAAANLDLQRENILEARSRIADTDVAVEVSNLVQAQVLRDFGIAVLAQANQNPARALKLL